MFEVLNDDYNMMLTTLYNTYGLDKYTTLEHIKEKYTLNRLVFHKQPKLVIRKKLKNNITTPPDCNRCIARVWGGKDSVKKHGSSWVCGHRCKRNRNNGNDFCQLHSIKQPHGIYNLVPPHNHYDKYKIE